MCRGIGSIVVSEGGSINSANTVKQRVHALFCGLLFVPPDVQNCKPQRVCFQNCQGNIPYILKFRSEVLLHRKGTTNNAIFPLVLCFAIISGKPVGVSDK